MWFLNSANRCSIMVNHALKHCLLRSIVEPAIWSYHTHQCLRLYPSPRSVRHFELLSVRVTIIAFLIKALRPSVIGLSALHKHNDVDVKGDLIMLVARICTDEVY